MKSNGKYSFKHINFSSLYYDRRRSLSGPRGGERSWIESSEQCSTSLIQYEKREKCVGKHENL